MSRSCLPNSNEVKHKSQNVNQLQGMEWIYFFFSRSQVIKMENVFSVKKKLECYYIR